MTRSSGARRTATALGFVLVLALGVLAWWLMRGAGPAASSSVSPVPRASVPSAPFATAATTVWITDGDTLDVSIDGVRTAVRLINVDAPERAHDGRPAQCLAEDARAELGRLAPVGSSVRLTTFGIDRYGRTLAAVHLADGRLANAEVVRAGLAGPLVIDGQRPLLAEVAAAQAEAASGHAGLHGSAPCSIPGRLASLRALLSGLTPTPTDRAATRATASEIITSVDAVLAELHADARDALVQGLTDRERADAESLASLLGRDARRYLDGLGP